MRVFPALTGSPIDPGTVNTALHTALHIAGLPRLRVHDLRHTAATLLLEQGIHPKLVQDLLGHSSIALTLDTYSHVTPRLHQEATDTMQGLLFGVSSLKRGKSTRTQKRRHERREQVGVRFLDSGVPPPDAPSMRHARGTARHALPSRRFW